MPYDGRDLWSRIIFTLRLDTGQAIDVEVQTIHSDPPRTRVRARGQGTRWCAWQDSQAVPVDDFARGMMAPFLAANETSP